MSIVALWNLPGNVLLHYPLDRVRGLSKGMSSGGHAITTVDYCLSRTTNVLHDIIIGEWQQSCQGHCESVASIGYSVFLSTVIHVLSALRLVVHCFVSTLYVCVKPDVTTASLFNRFLKSPCRTVAYLGHSYRVGRKVLIHFFIINFPAERLPSLIVI